MSNFRKELLSAAVAAQQDGNLSRGDLIRLRFASLNPKILQQIEATCTEQATADDLVSSIEGINWEGLTAFLKEILPLILPIILKLLGL